MKGIDLSRLGMCLWQRYAVYCVRHEALPSIHAVSVLLREPTCYCSRSIRCKSNPTEPLASSSTRAYVHLTSLTRRCDMTREQAQVRQYHRPQKKSRVECKEERVLWPVKVQRLLRHLFDYGTDVTTEVTHTQSRPRVTAPGPP